MLKTKVAIYKGNWDIYVWPVPPNTPVTQLCTKKKGEMEIYMYNYIVCLLISFTSFSS
jgi:hypothetical protein